ncbi:MAG: hypothetical protein EP343_18770 [Deltaproteobacteria bacterium]|nr:MAG: hypothetical protein EP343_18770 [Deltaproteobacteria bacterium]
MSLPERTEVLVVGAGPSGMVSALCLARLGVPCVLIERSESLSTHPKAHELNARSIEILVALGFTYEELAQEASPHEDAAKVLMCHTIQQELGCINLLDEANNPQKYQQHIRSSQPYLNLSQTELERLLLQRVRETKGITLLLGHQWEAFAESQEGTTSKILRRSDQQTFTLTSRYVVAADGAGSRVRKSLNIEMDGPEKLQDFISVYIEMDLSQHVTQRGKLYWLLSAEAAGTMIAHHVEKRWVYHIPIFPPYEQAEDYTEEVLQQRIKTAIGGEVPFHIRSIGQWRMTAQIARQFQQGSTFLIGDAAHRFPPTGGLGMNTGIADAHNLAWKIAAVLHEQARPELLETYEQERRPVAQVNGKESLDNYTKIFEVVEPFGIPPNGLEAMARWKNAAILSILPASWKLAIFRWLTRGTRRKLEQFGNDATIKAKVEAAITRQTPHFDRIGLDIGYVYKDGARSPRSTTTPNTDVVVTEYTPSTEPGARFPHIWLDASHTRSSHDQLSPTHFTLLLDEQDETWRDTFQKLLSPDYPLKIQTLQQWADEPRQLQSLRELCALPQHGFLLIRPDGHVACRFISTTDSPQDTLQSILRNCYLQPTSPSKS